jgi:hypothetical protein
MSHFEYDTENVIELYNKITGKNFFDENLDDNENKID